MQSSADGLLVPHSLSLRLPEDRTRISAVLRQNREQIIILSFCAFSLSLLGASCRPTRL